MSCEFAHRVGGLEIVDAQRAALPLYAVSGPDLSDGVIYVINGDVVERQLEIHVAVPSHFMAHGRRMNSDAGNGFEEQVGKISLQYALQLLRRIEAAAEVKLHVKQRLVRGVPLVERGEREGVLVIEGFHDFIVKNLSFAGEQIDCPL